MGRLITRLKAALRTPSPQPNPPPALVRNDGRLMRPIRPILVIVGSYMPNRYYIDLYRIYRSSFYMAPEVMGDPWEKLGALLTSFFEEEFQIGPETPESEFSQTIKTLVGIMTDKIDYSKYLSPDLRWPTRTTQESFNEVIETNKKWLQAT